MTGLYAINASELIKNMKKTAPKKGKKKEPVEPEPVTEPETPAPKPKKEKTPAQLEALKKAQEARKRKREEKLKQEEETRQFQEAQTLKKEAEVEEKRVKQELAKEKRRVARLAKKTQERSPPQSDESVDGDVDQAIEEVLPAKKKQRTKKEPAPESDEPMVPIDEEPPKWVKGFIETIQTEITKANGEKKTKTEIKQEAKQIAETTWANPETRGKIVDQAEKSGSKMYKLIFNKK